MSALRILGRTLKVGDLVRTRDGWLKVTGWGARECGADDERTGLAIIDGRYEGEKYHHARHGSWIYADQVQQIKGGGR